MAKKDNSSVRGSLPGFLLSPGAVLFIIIAFAAAIRIWAAHIHPLIMNDETVYARMAQNLRAGHLPWDITGNADTVWTPLLPITMAGLRPLVNNMVTAGYITDIFFGSLLLIPTYLLGVELVNRRVGLLAAALMGISPLFVNFSSMIYSESEYICFFLFGLLFGWRLLTRKTLSTGILTGVALGIAYISIATAVIYLVILLVLGLLVAHFSHSWKQLLKPLLLMVAVFLVIGAPYVFFLHTQLHQWTFTGKDASGKSAALDRGWDSTAGWNDGAMALTANGTETQLDQVNQSSNNESTLGAFFHHPLQRIKTFYTDLGQAERKIPDVLFIGLLPLFGLGLFANSWDISRAKRIGYTFLMITPAIPMLAVWFDGNTRFFMPFLPLIMIWVANGWRQLEVWGQKTVTQLTKNSGHSRLYINLIPWVVGVLVILPILPVDRGTVQAESYPVGMEEAGKAIHGKLDQKKLMCLETIPAYYAGDDWVEFPDGTYKQITAYARAHGVNYMVIDAGEMKEWRPQLEILLQAQSKHPEWSLVTIKDKRGGDDETYVFQLHRNLSQV